jgi:hypothetical protein
VPVFGALGAFVAYKIGQRGADDNALPVLPVADDDTLTGAQPALTG